MSKKQNCTAMSSAEAEYVALSASCVSNDVLVSIEAFEELKDMKLIAGYWGKRHHGPSDAMHNPSQPFEFLSTETCLICHGDTHVHKLLSRVLRNIIVIFARTFRVILFSIHNDEWKSFQCHHQTALRGSKSGPRCLDQEDILSAIRFLRFLTQIEWCYLRSASCDGPYMLRTVLIAAVEAAEKEAIFLILTGIGDEIYSTVVHVTRKVDKEQLASFTNASECSISSTTSTRMRFKNEVNDIRSERLARSANPLALLAAAQPYSDNYYQAPVPQRSNAPSYKQSSSTRTSASTIHKGKEIAKPVTPQSESVSEEDSDPEQARRDKDMQ
ncbi:hypothetical protein Tco_0040872 [Tanacetum coccineum]